MRHELVWTHGLDDVQTGVIGRGFFDFYTETQLDSTEELWFTIAADHPKAYLLAEDLMLRHRGRRYRIHEITRGRRGTQVTITVEAHALWYRLGEVDYVGSLALTDVSPLEGLQTIVEGSGWDADTERTSDAGAYSMEQQDKSVLAMLRTWAKITNRYLVLDTMAQQVALVSTRGADLGVAFRVGTNLRGVTHRRRPPEVTVLYPWGKDDLTIAGVNGGAPYLEDFSFYTDQGLSLDDARRLYTKRRNWVDSSFLKDTELLAAAQARLAERSQRIEEIELDVVDLASITEAQENVRVGDRVIAHDPEFDDQFSATVTRYRRFWLEPWRNDIELSTSLSLISDPAESTERTSLSDEWVQFVGPVEGDYEVRSDGLYVVAAIPLRFRDGGRANFHLDLWATGVGAGTMHVEVYDSENAEVQFKQIDVAYTDGGTARATLQWAAEDLIGAYYYKVRVTTTADGGPSGSLGVDIAKDRVQTRVGSEASFWIMAQGAVQETPTELNSITFDFNGNANGTDGTVQTWEVPENVTEVTIQAKGAAGAGASAGWADNRSGYGCDVTAERIPVTPGETLYVYVGGNPTMPSSTSGYGGWPNGGAGGGVGSGSTAGGGGGGSSHVMRSTTFAAGNLLICAPGGGGCNAFGASRNEASEGVGPGIGGFYGGGAGNGIGGANIDDGDSVNVGGGGATQTGGGAAGSTTGGDGTAGSFGQGGDAVTSGSSFRFPGGGGGGGYYGGGGAGAPVLSGGGFYAGDGGGGSGYVDPFATNLQISNGTVAGNGQVTISWGEEVDLSTDDPGTDEPVDPDTDPVEPTANMLVGAATQRRGTQSWLQATTAFETIVGKRIPISRRYINSRPTTWNAEGAFSVDTGKRHRVISFKGAPNQSQVETFLNSIPQDGFQTWVAWSHEPENDGGSMTEAFFKARCATLLAACTAVGRSDIHPTVIYLSYLERDGNGSTSTEDWFPDGDLSVWTMGLDPYDQTGTKSLWQLASATVALWNSAGGGDWMITETGTVRTGTDGANWITDGFDELRANGCAAVLWFHSNVGDIAPEDGWYLTAGPMAEAFAAEIP